MENHRHRFAFKFMNLQNDCRFSMENHFSGAMHIVSALIFHVCKMMNVACIKNDEFCVIKMMNVAVQTMNFVVNMMNFVLKMTTALAVASLLTPAFSVRRYSLPQTGPTSLMRTCRCDCLFKIMNFVYKTMNLIENDWLYVQSAGPHTGQFPSEEFSFLIEESSSPVTRIFIYTSNLIFIWSSFDLHFYRNKWI